MNQVVASLFLIFFSSTTWSEVPRIKKILIFQPDQIECQHQKKPSPVWLFPQMQSNLSSMANIEVYRYSSLSDIDSHISLMSVDKKYDVIIWGTAAGYSLYESLLGYYRIMGSMCIRLSDFLPANWGYGFEKVIRQQQTMLNKLSTFADKVLLLPLNKPINAQEAAEHFQSCVPNSNDSGVEYLYFQKYLIELSKKNIDYMFSPRLNTVQNMYCMEQLADKSLVARRFYLLLLTAL